MKKRPEITDDAYIVSDIELYSSSKILSKYATV